MNQGDFERLLTVEQVADVLRIDVGFVRRLVAQRRIRFVRLGRQVRIPERGLTDFIAAVTVEPRVIPAPRHVA